MKHFWTPTILLLIILMAYSILAPGSMIEVLAAKNGNRCYAAKKITPAGGELSTTDGTKLIIPKKALSQPTYIEMEVTTDKKYRTDFVFAPHGTVFAEPARLELSWDTLKGAKKKDLILYYYDEAKGEWAEETIGQWIEEEKKVVLFVNHFSQYHFNRR